MHRFFEAMTEVVGWILIVASPLLAGSVIACLIYFSDPTGLRLVIAIAIVNIGLIVGIVWANRVWKKHGTVRFLSRMMATPELDDPVEENKEKEEK